MQAELAKEMGKRNSKAIDRLLALLASMWVSPSEELQEKQKLLA